MIKPLESQAEYPNCNLCGSTDSKILFSSGEYPDSRIGNVVCCQKCGLIYRNPCIIHQHDSPDKLMNSKTNVFKDYLKIISSYRNKNRILDVGPGYGYFLFQCVQKGWEAWGVERRPDLVEFARNQYGIAIINEKFENADLPYDYFDVVTLFNVLDHLADPAFVLNKVFRILRPGGIVLIRSPNAFFHIKYRKLMKSLYHLWDTISRFDIATIHLYSFSKDTMCKYLRKSGFSDIFFWNSKINFSIDCTSIINVGKIAGRIVELSAEALRMFSNGDWVIGPSISVRAAKPLMDSKSEIVQKEIE